jgi:hypothetical protein
LEDRKAAEALVKIANAPRKEYKPQSRNAHGGPELRDHRRCSAIKGPGTGPTIA